MNYGAVVSSAPRAGWIGFLNDLFTLSESYRGPGELSLLFWLIATSGCYAEQSRIAERSTGTQCGSYVDSDCPRATSPRIGKSFFLIFLSPPRALRPNSPEMRELEGALYEYCRYLACERCCGLAVSIR